MKIDVAYNKIRETLDNARKNIFYEVNRTMVKSYWEIGKIIRDEEQKGKQRAKYGTNLIDKLSDRLTQSYGRGFTERNLRNMRQFYSFFPKWHSVRAELGWTHYRYLLNIDDVNARNFYMIETANNNWSSRELSRQINSMLFERLVLSRDKKKVLELSRKGQIIEKPSDLIKDPYIFEFLDLPESSVYSESEMEESIITNLKHFLIELGKGFMFVERQKRITLNDEHFYIDLVFYNRVLKCFVLIELKIGKLTHKDIGQLQMYVNYYDRTIRNISENPTIGILLCSDKKEAVVEYTLPLGNRQIFATKYRLYLPSKKQLVNQLKKAIFI